MLLGQHEDALGAPLRGAGERLGFLLRRVWWPALALVPLASAAIAWAISTGLYAVRKGTLEDLALWATGGFVAACGLRYAISRQTWFLWATALMATLMAREIRFEGASDLVYVALALLAWIALRSFASFRSHLSHPALLTGLASGFFVYAVSVAVDQRWARSLPGEEVWQMLLEETLELIGHCIIGATLLWSPRSPGQGAPPSPSRMPR